MEQKFFDAIYAELSPVLCENGFSFSEGVYQSDSAAYKIEYNAEGKVFMLMRAAVENGSASEYSAVTSYLFDEDSTVSDATAVGIDFLDTVSSALGLNARKQRTAAVELPQKSDSETPGIEDLTSKLLAIFPKHKDAYKEHIAEYSDFLYANFYLDNFAPDLSEIIESGNDKKLRKTCDALNELYCKGNRNVSDAVVVLLFGAAVKGDAAKATRVLEALKDHQYLKPAVHNIIKRTAHDKKLKEMYKIG